MGRLGDDTKTEDHLDSIESFDVLSDERRMRILLALSDEMRDDHKSPSLQFSELRKQAGIRDTGNFNYHLNKLRDELFVEKTDDGYHLTPIGLKTVGTVLASSYQGEASREMDVSDDCPLCGGGLNATYEKGILRVKCTNHPDDHIFENLMPLGGIEGKTTDEVMGLMTIATRYYMELALENTCPICYGKIDVGLRTTEDDEMPYMVGTVCDRCGARIEFPVRACITRYPDVISFYHDHGINIRESPYWAPDFWETGSVEIISENPLRLQVTLSVDDDKLELLLDDNADIVEVENA
ncbi:MAG: winged helix-turn-helix domain-containing protein [Halobacteria archaeon]|nr:winged helix-turn-helix domain-containing protein [Halobacteria archaeon]